MSRRRTTAAVLLVLLAAWASAETAGAAVPRLIFPVVAKVSYTNDFGAPRWQGSHEGNDIMAAKRSPVVAVERGRVVKWTSSRSAGCMLYLHGRSGTTYMYVHLNNDRTLRNDNRGGCRNGIAYAPGLRSSQYVRPGQLIGYVGDSGDANGIASHLHFEVHPNGGRAVSPYRHLRRAAKHLFPRPRGTDPIGLRVQGTVVLTRDDLDPQRIAIRVSRVRMTNDWSVRPGRGVTLTLPAEAVLRRAVTSGEWTPATIAEFKPGRVVRAWTPEFRPTLASARARAGVHAARNVLLRLSR
ncbi:MAG TPA: M23 family metallopeptidase [Gaiellaceae bacterium]|nr:M23 family metallopeptidase [Gaiellaceae bacterium]